MIYLKEKHSDEVIETIYAIEESRFEKVNLADCYDRYGQEIGHYNAADYSLDNSASDAKIHCAQAIRDKFNISEENSISIERDGGWEIETDADLDIEKIEEINDFIEEWEEENSYYEEVLAYDYWDGNNWKSIIIEGDNFDDCVSHEKIEDEDLVEKLNEAIENKEFEKEGFGKKIYTFGDYEITESFCVGSFAKYEIREV